MSVENRFVRDFVVPHSGQFATLNEIVAEIAVERDAWHNSGVAAKLTDMIFDLCTSSGIYKITPSEKDRKALINYYNADLFGTTTVSKGAAHMIKDSVVRQLPRSVQIGLMEIANICGEYND